jgi:ankyrin repeat protein
MQPALAACCVQIGQNALHIAALWGNLETIRTLIELGADVNCPNQR